MGVLASLVLASESTTGWIIGYAIGIVVVLVVVALVVPILLLARSIGADATKINDGLLDAVRHTASLTELNTTNESAEAIVDGLHRGSTRLGG
jgi:hypothetical protein